MWQGVTPEMADKFDMAASHSTEPIEFGSLVHALLLADEQAYAGVHQLCISLPLPLMLPLLLLSLLLLYQLCMPR